MVKSVDRWTSGFVNFVDIDPLGRLDWFHLWVVDLQGGERSFLSWFCTPRNKPMNWLWLCSYRQDLDGLDREVLTDRQYATTIQIDSSWPWDLGLHRRRSQVLLECHMRPYPLCHGIWVCIEEKRSVGERIPFCSFTDEEMEIYNKIVGESDVCIRIQYVCVFNLFSMIAILYMYRVLIIRTFTLGLGSLVCWSHIHLKNFPMSSGRNLIIWLTWLINTTMTWMYLCALLAS